MQFGPPMDRSKILGLVEGSRWCDVLELNRMAFSDRLPRNSESRALSVAMRLLKRHAPQVKWLTSFADGTQCGDGTIYRAAGWLLTQIVENNQIIEFPDGERVARLTMDSNAATYARYARKWGIEMTSAKSWKAFKPIGARMIPGFMLRYMYFLDKAARTRLTCDVLPYSEIDRRGARMYLGNAPEA